MVNPTSIDSDTGRLIITFRLLIARAAQTDSLRWWEDESLTEAGNFLLKRLFPNQPASAGKKLALLAAESRHCTIFQDRPRALHLFRLDFTGDIELALRDFNPGEISIPESPIESAEGLGQMIADLLGDLPEIKYGSRGPDSSVRLRGNDLGSTLDRVKALAAGYLQGDVNQVVFPYMDGV